MEFNKERFDNFIEHAVSIGYRHYPGQEYHKETKVYWKSLYPDNDNDKDNSIIIGFSVYDFTEYADMVNAFKETPYHIEYRAVLREFDGVRRMDLDGTPDNNYTLEEFEEYVLKVDSIVNHEKRKISD